MEQMKCFVSDEGSEKQMTRLINHTDFMIYYIFLQPDDRGTIGGVSVLRVLRQGPEAVHFVDAPLEEGQEVQLKVDWERRFDHMQQHSGDSWHSSTLG